MGKTTNKVVYVGDKNTEISTGQITVKSIYVTKKGDINDRMHLYNGDKLDFTVDGEEVQMIPYINREFGDGLKVKFDNGKARYLIVY